jgi:hypothetical protein
MTFGWDGPDPDANDAGLGTIYELGPRFITTKQITISAIRIWNQASVDLPGRTATIWDHDGNAIQVIDIPDTLGTTGWETFTLATPVTMSAGTVFTLTYSILQYYGGIFNADLPNASEDGSVIVTEGRYGTTQGQFPTNVLNAFYGIDVVYSVGVNSLITANEEWLDDILDSIVSDAQRSGYFDKVNTHEPKRAPNSGLTAAVWVQSIDPIALISGLAATSGRIVFTLRVYSNMLKEPQDAIDPQVMKAISNLMRRYHDDFDFEGSIRNIDLLGAHGIALAAQAGYLDVDGKFFRIMDLTIPCLVDAIWPQVN